MPDPITPAAPAAPADVSTLGHTIAQAAGMLASVAQVLAGMQPDTILGKAAAVVAEVAPAVAAEASGDAATAQADEKAVLDDLMKRLSAYEQAHSVNIVTVIHEMATRIFGGPKAA